MVCPWLLHGSSIENPQIDGQTLYLTYLFLIDLFSLSESSTLFIYCLL
ncbi:MAG: hypothetical protein N4A37_14085 [Prolixibacteraceae bacterium]|nr:hypothetical protein [Prolixibacteraceae bacterium]